MRSLRMINSLQLHPTIGYRNMIKFLYFYRFIIQNLSFSGNEGVGALLGSGFTSR
jgi:hypothetical protein